MYQYEALITKVYDGDTVTADVDLGMKVWTRGAKLRMEGINAPEIRGKSRPQGILSRDYLRSLVLGKLVVVTSRKRGKYGRWIVTISLDGVDINQLMITEGYALKY